MVAKEGESINDDDVSEFVCRDFHLDDGLTSQPDPDTLSASHNEPGMKKNSKIISFFKIFVPGLI